MIKSFKNAFRGLAKTFKEERNFRIQIVFAILIIILMFYFGISKIEQGILLLLIMIVLLLEILNSILERFLDVLKPRVHSYVKDIKDIASAAVLLSAIFSSVIGIIIFYPYVRDLIFNAWWV